MTQVWVLHSGCLFEGGSLGGLFASEQSARTEALKLVEAKNIEIEAWNKRDREETGHESGSDLWDLFVERRPNNWDNRLDYITVFAREVKP